MASLQDILVSKVRVKLLEVFLSQPGEIFYVRQLVRKIEEEINAVRRELARMEDRGMVKKESRGNRLYYEFRQDYPFYDELLSFITKTTGLGQAIIKNRNKIGTIKFATLSGKFARRKSRKQADVDLLIVGDIILPQLAVVIREYETMLKREINYTAMTKEEFNFRRKRRDPFIMGVLAQSRIMIIGDEEEMLA